MLWTALALGFVGSLHCLGMCGPIVVVLPVKSGTGGRFLAGRVLYNLGRAATYGLLGAAVGIIGQAVALAGYQQILGITAGSLMILGVLLPSKSFSRVVPQAFMTGLAALKTRLGALLGSDAFSSLFLIGVLNGLLPCGLVYSALAASLAAGGPAQGALYMALFGVGTMPAMFALSFAGGLLTARARRSLVKIIPVTVVLMGAFFILRGLALGIPYVSPKMERMLAHSTKVAMSDSTAVVPSAGKDTVEVEDCCK
jgi:sulfite exporter TauE/SafE